MKCQMCGKELLPGCRKDKKYCCNYCRLKAMRKRNGQEKHAPG
nr:MAG TPA: TFIIB zinc-binding [Caudoviricetes sp.]